MSRTNADMTYEVQRDGRISEIQKSELIRKEKRKGIVLFFTGVILIILSIAILALFTFSANIVYVQIAFMVLMFGGTIAFAFGLTIFSFPSEIVEEKAMKKNFSKWKQERAVALRDHIRRMGYRASTSKELGAIPRETIYATIKFENLSVDFLEFVDKLEGEGDNASIHYEYHCIVLADLSEDEVNGPTFKACGYKVRKNIFSIKVVDFKWNGEELARILNDDEMLRRHILAHHDKIRSWIEIYPCKDSHGIRISPTPYLNGFAPHLSEDTFPTVQALEVCDMIAFHIRKMLSARSSKGMP